jgi:hypothetical protein
VERGLPQGWRGGLALTVPNNMSGSLKAWWASQSLDQRRAQLKAPHDHIRPWFALLGLVGGPSRMGLPPPVLFQQLPDGSFAPTTLRKLLDGDPPA